MIFVVAVERFVAPLQLLGGEADQSAMGRNGRKCPAKTETIRQKDVSAFHTKFLPIIILTKHDVTNRRLYGRNQCISGIPAGSADMPTTALYEFLHLFVLRRIIFLHPSIFHTSFKIKNIPDTASAETDSG